MLGMSTTNAQGVECPVPSAQPDHDPDNPYSPISPVSCCEMNRAMRARAVGVAWTANVRPQLDAPTLDINFIFLEAEAAHMNPVNWGAWSYHTPPT